MKPHLPKMLRTALMATFTAALSLGSATYASTTYSDLTTKDYFVANEHVYNTGTGKFYLETEGCALNLTLTMNINAFEDYQKVHDYANGGNYSSFVSWTYAGNASSTYGLADISSNHSSVNYSGITGMWNGSPWSQTTANRYITLDTLRSYADESGNVTLTINNNPGASSNHVTVTAQNAQGTQTLYAGDGLRSNNYTSQHITSFTVNMNYVKSVTLNTESTLDPSSFTPPKDYSIPFESERTDGTSVGRVLFMGDSITHGVEEMSWRWGLFKTFVDNGIENEIAGPLTGYNSAPLNSDYNGDSSSSQYGGQVFENVHYAQASGRTHNMLTASSSQNSLEGKSTGVNYGGVSSYKVGKEYNADTYIMMMGTNDILSDGANTAEKMATVTERLLGAGSVQNGAWENADKLSALVGIAGTDPETAAHTGKWGTMGQIIDNMKMGESDTMYVLSIPTWAQGRQNIQVYANYVPDYNANLKLWTEAYSASHTGTVKYVDINRGLIDKTLGGTFLGPNDFFRPGANDSLHPNEQGALIIAGNLAQGMGLAGRTAGLERSAAHQMEHGWLGAGSNITIGSGQTVEAITGNRFNANGGYTIDFNATFGDGSANGWATKSNALSISVGDGSNVGTLKLSEGYISWGDKLLFCQDNSLTSNDSLRIAFTEGNTEQNIGGGYYVWLGDMLIGQALTAGTGTLNGVTLSATGGTGHVTNLAFTNTAYAPTTTLTTSFDKGNTNILQAMASHDNTEAAVSSGIIWTGATDKSVAKAAVVTAASAFTDGKATINVTGTGTNFFAAANVTAEGSVEARVDGQTASSAFAVLGGTLTGDVTMEFSNSSVANGSFNGATGALIGSYNGASIEGTFAAYIDNTSFAGDIVCGALTGAGSIDGVNLVLNSGAVNGTVYGGSKSNGTVGDGTADGEGNFDNTAVAITVNGGHITGNVNGGGTAGTVKGNTEIVITGGVIDGNITGGDIQGKSTVTVDGNKASIGGSITADTVKLKNVSESGATNGFDKYTGTITATNLELSNYDGLVNAVLVTDYVTVSNGTDATVHGLTLRNCSITAEEGSTLTLGEHIHSGNTISYSGDLRLEDHTSFTIDTPTTTVRSGEGFSDGSYIYKVSDGQTGSLSAADGSALTEAHTATFTGTGDLEGSIFTYESETGSLVAYSTKGNYNLVSSTVNYSDISTASGITMTGGQLNLDTDLTSGTITATGGTVNIGEGVTLVSSSVTGTVKVTGEGALSIGNKKVLPTGISLDETGWAGTVVLSGEVEGGHSFQNLSTANSSVTLQSVRSWIQKNGNVTAHLILDGEDNGSASGAALSITGANNAGNGGTYTFSGQLSGSGDIAYIQEEGRTSIFVISGDTSDWSGSFVNYNNGTPQVKLTPSAATSVIGGGVEQRGTGTLAVTIGANAATVNGAIQQINGTLNLTLEGTAITFNNEVTVNNLSASGKTITLGSTGTSHGALTVGGETNIGTLKMAGDGATATFNGTTTLGAIQANGGHGNMVIGGANELAAGSLSVEGANTQLTFEKKITIGNAEGGYANIHYSNTANNGIVVNFNEGLAHTGNGNQGYALLAGNGATVNMGGETDLSSKIIGLAAGATLSLKENASFTVGRIYSSGTQGNNGTLMLGNNASFTLTGGVSGNNTISALQMEDTATVTFNASAKLDNDNQTVGGTVKVNNVTLTLGHESASNTTQTYNRMELNDATLHAATKGDNNVRNFTTLAVGGSSTLTQASWHTLWNIGSLNNLDAQTPGTLTWDSTTNHNKTSIMTLTAAGDFSGKVVVDRHTNNASNGSYQAYLQVNHAQALQNATVELKGRNASNNAALALNTSAVTIAGLEGTTNSIVYAGAANTAPGSTAPTSTGTSTLTINAAADHSFAGTVASGISLIKEGTGTQTFNGNLNSFNGLVKANGGKLVLANSAATSESVAVALKGIFINNGTLELSGGKYTVGSTNKDDGLFAETKAVDTGSLVLSNGADLSVDASSNDWRFQVNSGEGAGIYVKGADSSLQASLNDGSSVSFKALDKNSETGAHLIANTGNGQSFKLNASNITVTDADYTVNGGTADKTLANKLENTRLTNEGSGKLTVSNSANTLVGVDAQNGAVTLTGAAASAATLTNIKAEGGDITLEGLQTAVVANLNDLYIGTERSVSLYQGTTAAGVEGVITVNGTLTAGENATLNADLVLGTNAKLDFTNEGLNMGSTLTLQSGSTITLGDTIIEYAATMVRFDSITLFTGVDALTIGGEAYNEATTYYAADYFDMSGIAYGDEMTIRYEAGTVSIYMATPEPATATLSLLALAALAARRRRR